MNGTQNLSSKRMWIARPATCGTECQILPVYWKSITALASTGTNYQILPGDCVFIVAPNSHCGSFSRALILGNGDSVVKAIQATPPMRRARAYRSATPVQKKPRRRGSSFRPASLGHQSPPSSTRMRWIPGATGSPSANS